MGDKSIYCLNKPDVPNWMYMYIIQCEAFEPVGNLCKIWLFHVVPFIVFVLWFQSFANS